MWLVSVFSLLFGFFFEAGALLNVRRNAFPSLLLSPPCLLSCPVPVLVGTLSWELSLHHLQELWERVSPFCTGGAEEGWMLRVVLGPKAGCGCTRMPLWHHRERERALEAASPCTTPWESTGTPATMSPACSPGACVVGLPLSQTLFP